MAVGIILRLLSNIPGKFEGASVYESTCDMVRCVVATTAYGAHGTFDILLQAIIVAGCDFADSEDKCSFVISG